MSPIPTSKPVMNTSGTTVPVPTSTSLGAIRFDDDGVTAHIDATAYQRHMIAIRKDTAFSPLQRKVFHEHLMEKGIVAFQETCVLTKNFTEFLDGIVELDAQTLDVVADYVTTEPTPANLTHAEMVNWVVEESGRNEHGYELLTMLAHTLFENETIKETCDILHHTQPWLLKKYITRAPENLRGKYRLDIERNLTHKEQLAFVPGRFHPPIQARRYSPSLPLTRIFFSDGFLPEQDVELKILGYPVTFMKGQVIDLYENGIIAEGTLAKDVTIKILENSINLDARSAPVFHDNGVLQSWRSRDNPELKVQGQTLIFRGDYYTRLHPNGSVSAGTLEKTAVLKTIHGLWLRIPENQTVYFNHDGYLEPPYPNMSWYSVPFNLTIPFVWGLGIITKILSAIGRNKT